MGKPSAPSPPSPERTAAAQTGTNVSTAVANAYLANPNQYTADGSLTFRQAGTGGASQNTINNWNRLNRLATKTADAEKRARHKKNLTAFEARTGFKGGQFQSFHDPSSNKTFDIPIMEAIQELSANQQAIKDASDKAQINLAETGEAQSAFLKDYLGEPADLSNEAVEGRLFDLGRRRLDPMFDERLDGLRTQLANSGIQEGSEAYERAMRRDYEGRNDAYNQLLLTGRGQAFGEAVAQRNQPINEITALLSGGQVSTPQPLPVQGTQMPTVDFAGLTQQNFANRMGIYNQEVGQRNQLLGGLFGLGAGALSGGII